MGTIKHAIFGELIQDWGVVSLREGAFATEQCSLSLHHGKGEMGIVLTVKHTILSMPNVWFLEITTRDLPQFVSALQTNYRTLCDMAGRPGQAATDRRHRIPFGGRMLLRPIYGIRSSRLLLGSKDPAGDESLDIYGFITRKSEPRVLLANAFITSNVGWVISGEALSSALEALSDFVDEQSRRISSSGSVDAEIAGSRAIHLISRQDSWEEQPGSGQMR